MKLSELRPGQSGTVTAVRGTGGIHQRLQEMGVIEGTPIEVIRFAPLGDPMQVYVNGYHLLLRKSEAALVDIVLEAPSAVAAGA